MTLWRISGCFPIIAALAMLAGEPAVAQQGAPGGATTSPYQQQPMPDSEASNGGAPSEGLPAAGASIPLTFDDQMFLRKTLQNGKVQVEMARLAALKSPSEDVKQYGKKMAQIREQLDVQLKPMAERLGVWTPGKSSKKAQEMIAKMRTMSGPDFDAAFIEAMLQRQESDWKRFKEEMENGHDPTVQQAAKMDEPVVSQRLDTLEQLAQTHNVPVESKQ